MNRKTTVGLIAAAVAGLCLCVSGADVNVAKTSEAVKDDPVRLRNV